MQTVHQILSLMPCLWLGLWSRPALEVGCAGCPLAMSGLGAVIGCLRLRGRLPKAKPEERSLDIMVDTLVAPCARGELCKRSSR